MDLLGKASPPPSQERSRGALLGLAVGDALGTTLEFREPKCPPFPHLAAGPHRDMLGGGPFKLVAGQVTDDTQMACCLAASLRARGRFDGPGARHGPVAASTIRSNSIPASAPAAATASAEPAS